MLSVNRMWWKRLLLTLLALAVVFLIWQFMPIQNELCWQHDLDPNLRTAVWMGVTWSMDAYADAELTALADDLRMRDVDTAFVYVSYLRAEGSFNPTYDHATDFLTRMREAATQIKWLAWVGVPISITQSDGTAIRNRLDNPDTRSQIAEFAAFAVTDLGFDGVHLNAEPVSNDDPAFLSTLDAIRAVLPTDAVFSTTAHALRSPTPITSIPYPPIAHHWTADYLHQVSTRVDQIALMAYDSGLPFLRDYRNWVAYQTRASAAALTDLDTELFIGLPTSEEWTPSHQTQAETFTNAIHAFKQAYDPHITGVALYPYWETTPNEWAQITDSAC